MKFMTRIVDFATGEVTHHHITKVGIKVALDMLLENWKNELILDYDIFIDRDGTWVETDPESIEELLSGQPNDL